MIRYLITLLFFTLLFAQSIKYIDPDILVFAYTPNENPLYYQKVWKDFIKYLEKVTAKKVIFFPYQTNMAEIKAMKAGMLHVAGFSTGSVPIAVKKAGFIPLFVMGNKKGEYGYRMEFITYYGSGIESLKDIKGNTLLLTAPSSYSGCKLPLKILKQKFNYKEGRDFDIKYSGRHSKSILSILTHKFKIAAIANSVKNRMIQEGKIKKNEIKVIYSSKKYPTTGYGYVNKLDPKLAKKVEYAFKNFKWIKDDGSKSSLKKYFFSHDRFIPIVYKDAWRDVIK